MIIMRRKGSKKHTQTRLAKNTVKALVLSFAAALIVMVMPSTGEAIVAVQAIPQVEQHMDAYLAEELGDNFVVGDSITIDLDDIFINAEELYYTVITYNSSVAGVTLLSGDLHGNLQIKALQTGTTMVQLIARATEFGTPVYEQFRLSVASIPDIGDEGIDIADIVSYMYTNPDRLASSDGVMQLLHNIKRVSPTINMEPTTSDGSYEVHLTVHGQVVLDMDDFYSDSDGDTLSYNLLLSSDNEITGVDLVGDQLTIDGSTNATVLTVEAEDGIAEHAKVSKDFNITILNNAPVGTSDTYTLDEDGILSTGNLLANDTDADGDTLTAVEPTYPSHGTLVLQSDGTFTYTPHANFYGTDSFSYKVYDGTTYSEAVNVEIIVTAVNDAPKALHEWVDVTLYNEQSIEIDLSQYFTDEEESSFDINYQINGTLENQQLISYNSDSLILTIGHSGDLSADSTLNISLSADDITDSHGPTWSMIHIDYKTLNAPPDYLYVDSQHTYDLASFYTFPNYKNNDQVEITFVPQDESDTQIQGVSVDSHGILSVAEAINGDFKKVVFKASDNHGATIFSTIKVIVDKEIRIKESAPTTFYGGRDGDVFFEIYLPDIFDIEGTKFDKYYFNGEPYMDSNLYFYEEYEDLPMTKTIQALDFYGNFVSYDIILDYNNYPTISYNNYGTNNPAITIGLEIGANSASVFDASHYAYDEDGDLLSYGLVATNGEPSGAITDLIQNGGEFLLQGTTKGKLDYDLTVMDPLYNTSYMPVEIYVVDKVVKLDTGENTYSISLTQLATALGLVNPTYDTPIISNPGVVEIATMDQSILTLSDTSVYGGTTLITITSMHDGGYTDILIFVEV
jgi:VCBS repeat-containing protein